MYYKYFSALHWDPWLWEFSHNFFISGGEMYNDDMPRLLTIIKIQRRMLLPSKTISTTPLDSECTRNENLRWLTWALQACLVTHHVYFWLESSCDFAAKIAAIVGKEQDVRAIVQCHPSFVEASDYEGKINTQKHCLVHHQGLHYNHVPFAQFLISSEKLLFCS